MAVVALTRVGVHPLRLRGYDTARLIMALELLLLTRLRRRRPALWSIYQVPKLADHSDGRTGRLDMAVQNSGMRLIWPTHPSTTVMTLNLTQLVLDGIVILREPKEAKDAGVAWAAVGAGGANSRRVSGRCGIWRSGLSDRWIYGGFAPAAVLLALIFLQEKPG